MNTFRLEIKIGTFLPILVSFLTKEMINMKEIKQAMILLLVISIITISLISPVSAVELEYDMNIVAPPTQNTAMTPLNLSFGELVSGTEDNTISGSFELTNTGNLDCLVSARFISGEAFSFGMVGASTSTILYGNEFEMMNTDGGSYQSLTATSTNTDLVNNTVISDGVADSWNVKISIPTGQSPEIYTGTVELTFSEVP